ncbi:MAG TPA: hypothetical protein VGB43_00735 [Flavobacterium sp.]
MENIFNPKYRKTYLQGYTFGLLPVFHDCEDMLKIAPHFNNDAFVSGFNEGRLEYEKLNGKISDGIPQNIVTEKVLEGFLIEGMLGMDFNEDGFTSFQKTHIRKYYQNGWSHYEPNFDISLYSLLALNGIDL